MNSIIFLILMAAAAGLVTALIVWADSDKPKTYELDSAEVLKRLAEKGVL